MRLLRTILTIGSFILFLIVIADRISHFWRANNLDVRFLRDEGAAAADAGLRVLTANGEVLVVNSFTRWSPIPRGLNHGVNFNAQRLSPDIWQSTFIGDDFVSSLGFGCEAMRLNRRGSTTGLGVLVIPHWLLAAVFAILPTHWAWRRYRKRKEFSEGICPNCAYDLRATPERCPECGLAITAFNDVQNTGGAGAGV